MRQRVGVAQAILGSPALLILDEPTNGLDVLVARAVLETVETLRDQGKCVIYSTHIMREVERVCDRVAIIDRGHIVALDSPEYLKGNLSKDQTTTLEDVFVELTGNILQ